VLWTLWNADLVQRINQGTLLVRLERNVEVNGGASGRGVSQLGGTAFQVCLTRMSSQGGVRSFAQLWSGTAASRTETTESRQ
jgi:hypothetical protein